MGDDDGIHFSLWFRYAQILLRYGADMVLSFNHRFIPLTIFTVESPHMAVPLKETLQGQSWIAAVVEAQRHGEEVAGQTPSDQVHLVVVGPFPPHPGV